MTLTSTRRRNALAERVKVSRVTPNLFPILGVSPARGRGIRAGDERAGAIAVISHELWRSHFGGAEDILERTVRLNGVEYAIVGVMPAGFAYPEPDMGAWTAARSQPARRLGPHRPLPRRGRAPCAGHERRRRPASTSSASRASCRQDAPAAYPADARWSIGFESLRAEPVRPHAAAARLADGGGGVGAAHRLRQRRDHVAAARARAAAAKSRSASPSAPRAATSFGSS